MKLDGKVALITGSGSGMGRAAALLFAREGAKVVVADMNEASAKETVELIRREGGESALPIRADVSKSADAERMVAETVSRFGGLDVAYNNAGIEGDSGFLAQLSEEAFDRVIAINLRGVWLGMKFQLPAMVKRGRGSIINTASIAGLIAIKGAAAYCAAKAGVISLTKVAALEYGRYNIRVNCICPGAIDTPMVERITEGRSRREPTTVGRNSVFSRMGQPDEIARTALFLASDDAPFATGAPFIIDGGWVLN
ncbi:MAG TPA: glucose 1-dehydrogenase [Candidatus Binataceae bacterium]|nr:glucose 1-dehydrogenase [Candidatus Binataceae bacterium]